MILNFGGGGERERGGERNRQQNLYATEKRNDIPRFLYSGAHAEGERAKKKKKELKKKNKKKEEGNQSESVALSTSKKKPTRSHFAIEKKTLPLPQPFYLPTSDPRRRSPLAYPLSSLKLFCLLPHEASERLTCTLG